MKAKITSSLVRSLEPRSKPFEVRDSQLSGFILRVQPSGVMSYYLVYQRPQGKQRYRLGRADALTVRQARDLAEQHAARVAMGNDIQAIKQQERHNVQLAASRTLGGFIDNHYGPWVKAERKTGQATVERLRSCFQQWFDLPLHEITPRIAEKWRSEKLGQERAKSTVNRDITALKALLSKAVDWDFLEVHPLSKMKPLKTDKLATIRYLSSEETKRLSQALQHRDEELKTARARGNAWRRERGSVELPSRANQVYADHLTPMILLSLNTGLRRGELFHLQWADINFESNVMTVHGYQAKSHLTRHIPLNREARDVLRLWRAQTQSKGLVFPGKNGRPFDNVKTAWSRVLRDADINNFRWHDMRHDFASKLVVAGVPLNTVRDLLGHADLGTTLRYAHLAPDHKAQAVEELPPTYPIAT